MKLFVLRLFVYIFLSSPLAWSAAPESSDRLSIKEIIGAKEVLVWRQGQENKKEVVSTNSEIFVGDILISQPRQLLTLEAFDGSLWRIAPDSRMKIEARVPQKQGFFHWVFALERGSMWGKVIPREGANDFRLKVKTRNAALGIRGTEYFLSSEEKRSRLDVLEGVVWFGNVIGFEPGTYVEVHAGEHAEIEADNKPNPPSKTTIPLDALQDSYGLGKNITETGIAASDGPDDCIAQGLGWKSESGSKQVKCVPKKDSKPAKSY